MPLALFGAFTSLLLAPGVPWPEPTTLAYGELARTICFSLVAAALTAVPVRRALRIKPWMILAATAAALLARLLVAEWLFNLIGRYGQLLIVVLELGPLLLAGLRSVGARSSLWRVRGVAAAALAMIAIAGWRTRLGPGMHFHCFGPSLSPGWIADGVMSGQGLRLAGASLASALFALAARREQRRLRVSLGALALACAVVAVRDALTLEAARRVMASLTDFDHESPRRLSPPFDVGGIQRLGELATAWDVVGGLALGAACALALLACLGQRGRLARVALRSIVLALPIGTWLLGPATDPPVYIHSTIEWVEPVWRSAGIEPPVADHGHWNPSIPGFHSETWVAGQSGEVLARYDMSSERSASWVALEPPPLPQVVADARAPLREILAQIEGRGAVNFMVRSSRAVELESATVARARFPFVEAATRELDAIELFLIEPEEYERLLSESASGCVALVRADLAPPDRPTCTHPSFVLDEVPEELRVSDLARAPLDRLFVIAPVASPPALPALQTARGRIPPTRGDLAGPFLVALIAALALVLVVARTRWSRRAAHGCMAAGSLQAGPIDPAWLTASACDVHTQDARTSYRAAPARQVRTARRFVPSLLRSAIRAIVDVRPWLALLLAVTLLSLGEARP